MGIRCQHWVYTIQRSNKRGQATISKKESRHVTTPVLSLQVKPKECYLKKYCNPKKREGLELQDIKKYGRQILEVHKCAHASKNT